MDSIFIPVFSLSTLGVICAVVLVIAAKLMFVKVDERLEKLTNTLPGVNCGACGYPGCAGYATALIKGEAMPNCCLPGGPSVMAKLSSILGVEAGSIEKKSAIVHCRGDCNSQQKKHDYKGIQSCEAASQLFAGEGACAFGCLGYGDCQVVCPAHAICLENGLARIDPRLCTGCGICVKTCPKSLISLEKAGIAVSVLCKNIEKGAVVRKKCSKGCIGCGKCVKECPDGAIVMENNLAVIDYEKCSGCGHCAEVCVTNSIIRHTPEQTC